MLRRMMLSGHYTIGSTSCRWLYLDRFLCWIWFLVFSAGKLLRAVSINPFWLKVCFENAITISRATIVNILIHFIKHNGCSFVSHSEFSNEKNRVDRRVQYYKCRNRKLFVEDMSSYLDWITQAGYLQKPKSSHSTECRLMRIFYCIFRFSRCSLFENRFRFLCSVDHIVSIRLKTDKLFTSLLCLCIR